MKNLQAQVTVQKGTKTQTLPAANKINVIVAFDTPFNTIPEVTLKATESQFGLICTITNIEITQAGFTCIVQSPSQFDATMTLNWIATAPIMATS